MMLPVLFSKSPLVVLIWPMVTRITTDRGTIDTIRAILRGLNGKPSVRYIHRTHPAEGSHNGSAAVLKTAGRKAMQVRVLSPPPLAFHRIVLHYHHLYLNRLSVNLLPRST